MHFCHEELFALLAMIPGISYLVVRLKVWWHERHSCSHPVPPPYVSGSPEQDTQVFDREIEVRDA